MQKTLLTSIFIFYFLPASFAQQLNVDSLLKVLAVAKEDTNKVNIYGNLTGTVKFTDPAKAIEYGKTGIVLAKKLGFDKGAAGCFLNTSTAYLYADKLDTSLLYLDTTLVFAHKVGDPKRLGLAYLNRSDIYRQMQNFTQSLKDCDSALYFADKADNDDVRARVNQTIGAVFYQQELYPQSIGYYDKATTLYRKIGNRRMSAVVLNNLGLVYKSIKDFPKAIAATVDAIRITDSLKDITNLSIFNGNLCDVYFEMGDYRRAEVYAARAMEYAKQQNNKKLEAIAWVYAGNIYLKLERFAESIVALNKAMPVFKEIDDTDRIYTTADMLAEAYALAGNYSKAYEYMRISQSANDSLVKWKYDDEVAAMQTKFKVTEKDKEIQLLAKDKELQQQKLKEQWLMMIGAATLALLALTGTWLLMNRNKLKQRMKELELRNQIAADLHDEVGSSLSSIHMLSQMATKPGNEATHNDILQRMSNNAKETMDKMGDIVWMIKPGETEAGSLKQRIERFAYEICSSKNIEVSLQLDDLEKLKPTMDQRKNIYLVFKEALNNAVKYSGSEKIEIKASTKKNELTLLVQDFGKGFDSSIVRKGNGLDNIQHRAKELNALLSIDSSPGNGTAVQLLVPL